MFTLINSTTVTAIDTSFELTLPLTNLLHVSTQQINGMNNMVIGQISTGTSRPMYICVIGLFCMLCFVCT